MHNSKRLIKDSVLGMRYPLTHIHVILMICVEAADFPQGGASCRHVRANETPRWCAGQWQTSIGAANHPIELKWKPTGLPHFEYRQWPAAHGAYAFVVIWRN
jgi:hypothetical protein